MICLWSMPTAISRADGSRRPQNDHRMNAFSGMGADNSLEWRQKLYCRRGSGRIHTAGHMLRVCRAIDYGGGRRGERPPDHVHRSPCPLPRGFPQRLLIISPQYMQLACPQSAVLLLVSVLETRPWTDLGEKGDHSSAGRHTDMNFRSRRHLYPWPSPSRARGFHVVCLWRPREGFQYRRDHRRPIFLEPRATGGCGEAFKRSPLASMS